LQGPGLIESDLHFNGAVDSKRRLIVTFGKNRPEPGASSGELADQ
jgi:hypothetical protein